MLTLTNNGAQDSPFEATVTRAAELDTLKDYFNAGYTVDWWYKTFDVDV